MATNNYQNAKICDNNQLERATIIAPESSPFVFTNAIDLYNRNKTWKPGTKTFTIEIDLLSNSQNVSFFAMLGESDAKLKLSNFATVTLKASSINLFDGSEPFTATATVGELGVYLNISSEENQDGVSYRYWNIEIDDSTNPDDIEIAYIYLGDNTIIHRNIANGFNYVNFDRSLTGISDSGKFFTLQKPEQTFIRAVSYQYMSHEDKENLVQSLRLVGINKPFLFVLDPDQCRENFDFSVRPCFFDGRVPAVTQIVRDIYSTTYNLREVM